MITGTQNLSAKIFSNVKYEVSTYVFEFKSFTFVCTEQKSVKTYLSKYI